MKNMVASAGFERSIQAIRAVQDRGWTYPSNFLDIYFDKIGVEENVSWMEVGDYCLSEDGAIAWPAFGVFVDVGLSNAARALLGQKASMATVALHLSVKKRPGAGKLKAVGRIKNTLEQSCLGAVMTEVDIYAHDGQLVATGHALMSLAPFKNALDVQALPQAAQQFLPWQACVPESSAPTYPIYQAACQAQRPQGGKTFIDRFWAAQPAAAASGSHTFRFYKGEHLANRAGNVHGGILYGIAANAAHAMAPMGWLMSESSVQYLNAASEKCFETATEVLRHGRNTMVVNCQIISGQNKKILHSQWTFLRPQDEAMPSASAIG